MKQGRSELSIMWLPLAPLVRAIEIIRNSTGSNQFLKNIFFTVARLKLTYLIVF